jgi:hypothetical protein
MIRREVFGQRPPKGEVRVVRLNRSGCGPGGRFGVAAVLHFNDFFRRETDEGVLREFSWAFSGFEKVTVLALMTKR